jgi:hypothetical protein
MREKERERTHARPILVKLHACFQSKASAYTRIRMCISKCVCIRGRDRLVSLHYLYYTQVYPNSDFVRVHLSLYLSISLSVYLSVYLTYRTVSSL